MVFPKAVAEAIGISRDSELELTIQGSALTIQLIGAGRPSIRTINFHDGGELEKRFTELDGLLRTIFPAERVRTLEGSLSVTDSGGREVLLKVCLVGPRDTPRIVFGVRADQDTSWSPVPLPWSVLVRGKPFDLAERGFSDPSIMRELEAVAKALLNR
ncbi:MAG: hypothetical protein U0610_17995 [bacterium]